MKIKQENFIKAWENRKLVAGALKAARIWKKNANYEDLFHEGVLIYAQMLELHPELSASEVDRLSFRKILWRTTDSLRRTKLHQDVAEKLYMPEAESLPYDLNDMIMLKNETSAMTDLERQILFEHIISGKTMLALAEETNASRRTIQRTKRKLIKRLQDVFAEEN